MNARQCLNPVLRRQRCVIRGTAGKKEKSRYAGKHLFSICAKESGRDACNAFERVGNGAGLLKNLLLHVMAVGAKIHGTRISLHHTNFALNRNKFS